MEFTKDELYTLIGICDYVLEGLGKDTNEFDVITKLKSIVSNYDDYIVIDIIDY